MDNDTIGDSWLSRLLEGKNPFKFTNWFKFRKYYQMVINPKTGELEFEYPKFRIKFIFKWFDFWIGLFVDTENRLIYIFPIPMFGFKIGYQYKIFKENKKKCLNQ